MSLRSRLHVVPLSLWWLPLGEGCRSGMGRPSSRQDPQSRRPHPQPHWGCCVWSPCLGFGQGCAWGVQDWPVVGRGSNPSWPGSQPPGSHPVGSRGLWAGVQEGWSPFEATGARLVLQHCPTALLTMLQPQAAVWFRLCRRSVSSARCARAPAAPARAASAASGRAGGRTRGLGTAVPRARSALQPRAPPRACALADSGLGTRRGGAVGEAG